MKKRDLNLYEKYSPEHDGLMLVDFTIVKNAYDSEYPWSFSVSNEATGMAEVDTMDGLHPTYKETFRTILDGMELKEKPVFGDDGDYYFLADYPRYESKLRILFKDWADCALALAKIKNKLGMMETKSVH
ncbi:MAG: hypothetical protein ACPGR4_03930 [Paracoccaceae bacterium]